MSSCNENCGSCKSSCSVSCPVCGMKGRNVPLITVRSLLKNKNQALFDTKTFICTNRKCAVSYFQPDTLKYFTIDDINTKIWFKSPLKDYICCYCHNIKLLDIVKIVKESNDDDLTKEKIFKLLNIKEGECIKHNPLGESCDKLFENAIEYAYKQKYDN